MLKASNLKAAFVRSLPILICMLFMSATQGQESNDTIQLQEPDAGINFFLDLAQDQKLEGIVVEIQKFEITTGFGDVQVPLDKIEGIRLNAMEDGSAVMAFKNGDILTGILHVNDLKLKTSWGFATVNIAYIQQISTSKGAVFSSSKADGKTTWRFTRGQ